MSTENLESHEDEIEVEDAESVESGTGKRALIIGITAFIAIVVVAAIGYKLAIVDAESENPVLEDDAACAMDSPGAAPAGEGVDSLLEFVTRERSDETGEGTNPNWFEENPGSASDETFLATTGFNVLDTCALPSEP